MAAEVRAVIDLFATQLAKLSFPDIDAGILRRQADELRGEAKLVARAREALDAALASYARRAASLGETCTRAIAYARIYSAAHPDRSELALAIAALSQLDPHGAAGPHAATGVANGATSQHGQHGSPTGKRRGRPPRRSAELFDASAQPSEPSETSRPDAS